MALTVNRVVAVSLFDETWGENIVVVASGWSGSVNLVHESPDESPVTVEHLNQHEFRQRFPDAIWQEVERLLQGDPG